MNYSTVIFLVNKNVRGVLCSYEQDADGKGVKPYTMFKTLDPALKPGDLVVVPTGTRLGFTVVRVEEVGVEPELEMAKQLDWIATAIDIEGHKKILEMEKTAVEAIKSAEKRRKREELAASLLKDNPELAKSGLETITADSVKLIPTA